MSLSLYRLNKILLIGTLPTFGVHKKSVFSIFPATFHPQKFPYSITKLSQVVIYYLPTFLNPSLRSSIFEQELQQFYYHFYVTFMHD